MDFAWFETVSRRSSRKTMAAVLASRQALTQACSAAVERSQTMLLDLQKPEGYWCGELLADTTLESDYILLQLWMHPPGPDGWNPPNPERIRRLAASILRRQLRDGGWPIYPQGPANISATVKAYVALKLAGIDPDSDAMLRARYAILEMGGVQAANSYTKINLSLFGLYPRKYVPTIPPELVLLPGGVLYEMSSWTRAIVVPLSIVQAKGGTRPVPPGFHINELAAPKKSFALPRRDTFSLLFLQVDRGLKLWENLGSDDLRRKALVAAEKWMIDHTRYSDGLGAIYPSMMYLIMALESLGYPDDHPDLREATEKFEALLTESESDAYFQPCFSPVWDTAIAMYALGEMGNSPEDRMRRAADWLIQREVRHKGDWSVKRPDLTPSGWAFEFNNEHYPDIDDTAMVLLALLHARASDPEAQRRCEARAQHWLQNMQSRDGGWAAFDVDNDWQLLNKVPFADHNAMLDPTCPDITGRVLESLSRRGMTLQDQGIVRGCEYLLKTQERNGSWYGRWGVDYIYGTFLALRGLKATRAPATEAIRKAARWLAAVQNEDGGWGESCESYEVDHFVAAPSTPSQTAWALIGLLASGESHFESLRRGIEYLVETQREDGSWAEDLATGTGFPNVFYMRYTLYRQYFPHLALSLARRALGYGGPAETPEWLEQLA